MDTEQLYSMIETRDSWEVFILDTVRSENMDPWDIDLVRLAEKCLDRIRNMKQFDFRVPAKVVLSSAVLLRMKSDSLILRDTNQIIQEYMERFAENVDELEEIDRELGQFPILEPVVIRSPQSKVTVDDLLGALRKVLNETEKKAAYRADVEVHNYKLEIPEFDITEAIENIYTRIKMAIREAPFLTFFGLLKKKDRTEIAQTILPVLHLANDRKIVLHQKKAFGQIKIYLPENAPKVELENES